MTPKAMVGVRSARFIWQGDIFGLESDSAHRFTAEAIAETTVRLIGRQSLQALADSDAIVIVAHNLPSMTSRNLEHAENQIRRLRERDFSEVACIAVSHPQRPRICGFGGQGMPMSLASAAVVAAYAESHDLAREREWPT